MAGKLFIISAPSGTGKTSLVNSLLLCWNNPHPLKRVVTYTTRVMRPYEVNGVDYFFITPIEFQQKREAGLFLETTDFCGNQYGSPRSVLDQGYRGENSYIFVIDQDGARTLSKLPGIVLIWIMPPSIEELSSRLQKRAKDSPLVIQQRIEKAQAELECEKQDHLYDYHVINDVFSRTLCELKSLIEAEIDELNA